MSEAVLNHERAVSSGGKNSAISADGSRFQGNRKLSQPAAAPREGWIRRAVLAAAGLAHKSARTTFVRGSHELCRGLVERVHLPNGGRICCQTGRIWITADGGGEDVVLSDGEFRWFRPGAWLLIEAIAKSEIIVEG